MIPRSPKNPNRTDSCVISMNFGHCVDGQKWQISELWNNHIITEKNPQQKLETIFSSALPFINYIGHNFVFKINLRVRKNNPLAAFRGNPNTHL